MRLAPIAAILVGLSGCSTTMRLYDGPPRPPEQIALLRNGINHEVLSTEYFFAHTINDARVLDPAAMLRETLFELPPGEHRIEVMWYAPGGLVTYMSSRNCLVTLPTTAGHEYVLEGASKGRRWEAWARDTTTQERFPCDFGDRPRCPVAMARVTNVPRIDMLIINGDTTVRLMGVEDVDGRATTSDPLGLLGQCVRVSLSGGGRQTGLTDPDMTTRANRYVFVHLSNGTLLNSWLLEHGFVTVDKGAAHGRAAEFEAAEAAARAAKVGRWAQQASSHD